MRTMKPAALTVTAMVCLAILSGCPQNGGGGGGGGANLTECKEALRKQYRDAISSGVTGTRPAACHDVSDEDLQRLAGEVLEEESGG